jgi:hypothetical protein
MNRNMQPKIHRSATTYSVQNSISDTLSVCPRNFHSPNLLCARILALATHRAGVDGPTKQYRRDGTACSPARECRVAYGLEASPGGTAHPGGCRVLQGPSSHADPKAQELTTNYDTAEAEAVHFRVLTQALAPASRGQFATPKLYPSGEHSPPSRGKSPLRFW